MKWFLALLLIFSLSYGFCPKDVGFVSASSCQEFCEKIMPKGEEYEIKGYGFMPTQYNAGVCGCRLVKKVEGKEVEGRYCEYVITRKETAFLKVQNALKDVKTPIVDTLIKMATFNGNVEIPDSLGTPEINLLAKGLYSTYVSVISSVSLVLSAYLLTIIAGWWLASQGYSEWSRLLRTISGGESYSIITSAESFRKFSIILLSVAVFSFPVKVSSPIMQSAGVGLVKGNWYSSDPCKEYEEQRANLESLEYDEDVEGDRQAILEALNESKAKCEAQKQANQGGALFKPVKSEDELYVPIALALVKSFVEYGLNQAHVVANYVNSWMQAYFVEKVNKDQLTLSKSLREQKKEYENALRDLERLQQTALSQTGCPFSCQEIDTISAFALQNRISENPECKVSYEISKSVCEKVKELRKKISEAESEVARQQQQKSATAKAVAQSLEVSQKIGGFASPSIVPMVGQFTVFMSTSVGGLEENRYEARLTKSDGWGITGAVLGVFYKVGDFLESATKPITGSVGAVAETVWDKGKELVNVDKPFAFVLGQIVTLSSFPPGSILKEKIEGAINWIGETLKSFISPLTGAWDWLTTKIPFLGAVGGAVSGFAKGTAGGVVLGFAVALGKVATKLASYFVAFYVNTLFFKVVPFVVVAFAVLFRVISYVVELIVFVISVPFYGVMASTRTEGVTLNFFKKTIKFMVFPMIIAFTPLVAFFVIELYYFFFFTLPSVFILSAMPEHFLGNFIAGIITAILYVFASLVAIVSGWNVAYHLPEDFYSLFSEVLSAVESRLAGRMEQAKAVVGRLTGATL